MNIPTTDTHFIISTKVDDIATAKLFLSLVPNNEIMFGINEIETELAKGAVYIELTPCGLSYSSRVDAVEFDKGNIKDGESPIVMYVPRFVDNLTFAAILQFVFRDEKP